MVEDLECVVAALGSRRPVLVGASMGGGTSLVAAGEDHVDATALVMVDIAPRIEMDGVEKIQAFMSQKPEGFDSLEEVAAAIASYQPHRKRPQNLAGLAKNVRLGADGKYHWHWDPRFRAAARDLDEAPAAPRSLRPQPEAADAAGARRIVGRAERRGRAELPASCARTPSTSASPNAGAHGRRRPQRHLRQRGHRLPVARGAGRRRAGGAGPRAASPRRPALADLNDVP